MLITWVLSPAVHAEETFDAHQLHLGGLSEDPLSPMRIYSPPSGGPHGWHAGVIGEYSRAPLVALEPDGQITPVLDHLVVANLSASYAPIGRLRLTVSAPFYAAWQGSPAGSVAFGDLRFALSGTLLNTGPVQLGVTPVLDLPTGPEGSALGRSGVGGGARLTARASLGSLVVNGEVGPDLTSVPTRFDYTRLDTALHVGWAPRENIGVNAEVHAWVPILADEAACRCTPAELSVWGSLGLQSGAHLLVGGAVGLNDDAGTSLLRLFVGGGFGRGAKAADRGEDRGAGAPADRFALSEDDDDRGAAGPAGGRGKGQDDAAGGSGGGGAGGPTGGLPGAGLAGAGTIGGALPAMGVPAVGLPGLPGWSGHHGAADDKDDDDDDDECEEKVVSNRAMHLPSIFFEPNRSALTAEGLDALVDATAALEKDPRLTLQVDIHTHERAGASFTDHIAERRQLQVLTILAQYGAPADRVTVETLGEPGDELADHRMARAELTLLGAAPPPRTERSKDECETPAEADQAVVFVGSVWSPTSLPALAAAEQAGKAGRTVAIVVHAGPPPVSEARRREARDRAAAVREELANRGVEERFLRIEVHDSVDPTLPGAPRVDLHFSDEPAVGGAGGSKP